MTRVFYLEDGTIVGVVSGAQLVRVANTMAIDLSESIGLMVEKQPGAYRIEDGSLVNQDGQPVVAPVPVPTEVSPLQAKIALRRAGFLESVETAVASAGEEALIAYRNALTFRRDSPMLQLIAAAVPGLADALDAIFTAAASIEV